METFETNFNNFSRHLQSKEPHRGVPFLAWCLKENEKKTINFLLRKEILFSSDFTKIEIPEIEISNKYKLLLRMISFSTKELYKAAEFLSLYSKKQILQGVANHLEKENALLKHNATWKEENVNASWEHMEVERQNTYSSMVGINFQTILDLFFTQAPEEEQIKVLFNLDVEEEFLNLFYKTSVVNELKDYVELHLYFNWPLKDEGNNKLKIHIPENKERTILHSELIQSLKNRTLFPGVIEYARRIAVKKNLNRIYNKNATPPKEFWKYVPDKNKEREMKAFMDMIPIDSAADEIYEQEVILYKLKYTLSKNDPSSIVLEDGSDIDLKKAFRIFSILKSLARLYIKKADQEFKEAAEHYCKKAKFSFEEFLINRAYRKHRGNISIIKKVIEENRTVESIKEKEHIIWQSKNKVSDSNCLVQIDFNLITKMIQWWYQWEEREIKNIISLFIYDVKTNINITDAPLFLFDNTLAWMPNSFAYQSAAEMLMENLIGKKLLTLHSLQTQIYENALANLFKTFKFAVIDNPKKKEYHNEKGETLGDFDTLVYKDGHLFHFELKLAHNKYGYKARYDWEKHSLKKGGKQLNTAKKFFQTNPNHIKDILGLNEDAPINEIHSFIISNSLLFDNEYYKGNRKISFLELTKLLMGNEETMYEEDDYLRFMILQILEDNPSCVPPTNFKKWAERKIEMDLEKNRYLIVNFVKSHMKPLWPGNYRDPALLAKYLNENRLFRHLQDIPTMENEMHTQVGQWTFIRPSLIPQNIYLFPKEHKSS